MGSGPQITLQTLKVLTVLVSDPLGEHYGLEIAEQAGLKSGTIYPILVRLEKHRWVTSNWEQIDPVAAGRRPRRYYRLSPYGAERARQHLQQARQVLGPNPARPPMLPAPGVRTPGDAQA